MKTNYVIAFAALVAFAQAPEVRADDATMPNAMRCAVIVRANKDITKAQIAELCSDTQNPHATANCYAFARMLGGPLVMSIEDAVLLCKGRHE